MKEIIDRKLYDTDTADLIASDDYWDGRNTTRHGRNAYLYKTAKGNFFIHRVTHWQGERDSIAPLSKDEAMELYEQLPEKAMDYKEAFGVAPEIA